MPAIILSSCYGLLGSAFLLSVVTPGLASNPFYDSIVAFSAAEAIIFGLIDRPSDRNNGVFAGIGLSPAFMVLRSGPLLYIFLPWILLVVVFIASAFTRERLDGGDRPEMKRRTLFILLISYAIIGIMPILTFASAHVLSNIGLLGFAGAALAAGLAVLIRTPNRIGPYGSLLVLFGQAVLSLFFLSLGANDVGSLIFTSFFVALYFRILYMSSIFRGWRRGSRTGRLASFTPTTQL